MPRIASELRKPIKFCLFAASYAPLFLLIVLRRLYEGRKFIHWAGFHENTILVAVREFWLVYFLLIVVIASSVILIYFLTNFPQQIKQNGSRVKVEDINNKNSEAIGYISTYLVPMLFNDYTDLYSVVVLFILLLVIWQLYVNSTLMGINPTLNFFGYALYEIVFDDRTDYTTAPRTRSGLVIIRSNDVQEDDYLLLKRIAHKLYFAIPNA
jgi:hypothetical protein